jgi:hypothetical protein
MRKEGQLIKFEIAEPTPHVCIGIITAVLKDAYTVVYNCKQEAANLLINIKEDQILSPLEGHIPEPLTEKESMAVANMWRGLTE